MRPVRFVALSEDGMSLILTDEVGRMLTLTLDEAVRRAVSADRMNGRSMHSDVDASLRPRDIQARIRAGDSVEEVARVANVTVEKVLRFAGPVIAERSAISTRARHTRLTTSESNNTLGEVVDGKLREHGVDPESLAWDAYRHESGKWRIVAAWKSGRSIARAVWELERSRSAVAPVDDTAQFLSTDQQSLLAAEPMHAVKPKIAAARTFSDDEASESQEGPVVPSVSLLRRDRKTARAERTEETDVASREQEHAAARDDSLPSWDDILFGGA